MLVMPSPKAELRNGTDGKSGRPARRRRAIGHSIGFGAALPLSAPAVFAAVPDPGPDQADRCVLEGCLADCACLFDQWDPARRLKFGYGMTADPRAAAYWYRRAAEAGDPRAAYNWGLALKQGLGVERDLAASRSWLEKAANSGVLEAHYVLGNIHRQGLGTRRDPLRAAALYRLASERGHARSQHALGNMHGNGFGRGPDLVTAYKWWKLAADKGHPLAAAALLQAEGMMTWSQVLKARRLAEEWRVRRRQRR